MLSLSLLGPQLFTIYIDDLELGTKRSVSKFADDTKMSSRAKCAEDTESLQKDICSLSEWAKVWQMEYNVDKCEVIHFGRNDSKMDDYLMVNNCSTLLCRGTWVSLCKNQKELVCRCSREFRMQMVFCLSLREG